MRINKDYRIILFICFAISITFSAYAQSDSLEKPKISFSFDDGSTNEMGEYKLETWNELLLDNLAKYQVKAVLFSSGANKLSEKGKYVLSSWNNAGHLIANHSFSHPNFNSKSKTVSDFKTELLKNDSIINSYSNFYPYFRFPYLKEGNTSEKVEGFRTVLKENKYKNGHVTIDASDWYIDRRLQKRLKENPKANVDAFKAFYIKHLMDRALFYDSLAFQLTNRRVHHVILLHHNLAAALFLDDLIQSFKEAGWEIVAVDEAYKDELFQKEVNIVPAGESLIWSLAKASGKFEKILRYPAEDSEYEKAEMDKLGL